MRYRRKNARAITVFVEMRYFTSFLTRLLQFTMRLLISLLVLVPFFSFGQTDYRHVIKQALADKSGKEVCVNMVVPDKQTAIAVAEPILFKVYGQNQIVGEKPYNVSLIDGYWVLTGSLPKGWLGGTFLIILSAKDGRVIKLTHYK